MVDTPPPRISVIVPAHRAGHQLDVTLPALIRSTLPRQDWELIVVDDASGDDTSAVAARFADVVIRLPGSPHGPAYARNRGFEVSRGQVLLFIDADVRVSGDTLTHFLEAFDADPDLASVFGSYDATPTDPGFVSQYRNLAHHYVHQQNGGEAMTFWAGLGAIRAPVFAEAGGFDEWHYHRPQIEDIELGRRIQRLGRRIVLRPDIQATHLKRWTLTGMFRTDFSHRGVPWMWLMLKEGSRREHVTLNLQLRERVCTALTFGGVALLPVAAALRAPMLALAAGLALVLTVVLNISLYRFFRRARGWWFALRAIPLHLAYYLINGCSVLWGAAIHVLIGRPLPRADAAAFAQIGVRTWPPVPERPEKGIWSQL